MRTTCVYNRYHLRRPVSLLRQKTLEYERVSVTGRVRRGNDYHQVIVRIVRGHCPLNKNL